jgi:hypothetical protein
MAKQGNLIVRVDDAAKQRIKQAADTAGKSMTAFVLESTMKAVEKMERLKPRESRVNRGACPTFFRACCATARMGGDNGYRWAAYELTRALDSLSPDALDAEEWMERLEALSDLLEDDDEEAVFAWFDDNLPRCMALVPRRRRPSFLAGVHQFVEEYGTTFA